MRYSVRDTCDRLFAKYPLAVRDAECSGHIRSMVLMTKAPKSVCFHVLSYTIGQHGAAYSLLSWPAGHVVDVEEEIRAGRPRSEVRQVLRRGIPIPTDDSIFGWRRGNSITAMIAISAEYSPPHEEPTWSVLLHTGISQGRWPVFTRRRFFGKWFWRYYQAGKIIPLNDLIAETSGIVFWVDTLASLGSGTVAVAAEIRSKEGYQIPHGTYAYRQALQAGKPVPSLPDLLSDESRADLSAAYR